MSDVHSHHGLAQCLRTPWEVYQTPAAAADDGGLTLHDRLRVLDAWAADARQQGDDGTREAAEASLARIRDQMAGSPGPDAVAGCMNDKVEIVHPESSLTEAARRMAGADLGLLAVVDGDQLIGTVSDRDLVVRGLADDRPTSDQTVAEVMTRHVAYCHPADDRATAAAVLAREQVRRLLVLDSEQGLVGIIGLGDLAAEAPARAGAALNRVVQPTDTAKAPHADYPGGRAGSAGEMRGGTPEPFADRPILR